MARVAGSVTVDDDESATGSGLSKAIYDAVVASESSRLVSLEPPPTWIDNEAAWLQQVQPIRLRTLRTWAREAVASATGIIAYEVEEPPVSPPVFEFRSSGTATLAFGIHYIISSSGSISAPPPATADDVGKSLTITNRRILQTAVTRSGTDTFDGNTQFILMPGQSVRLTVVAAGSWTASVDDRTAGYAQSPRQLITTYSFIAGGIAMGDGSAAVTLTGSMTGQLSYITSPRQGTILTIIVTQDAVGGRTMNWSTDFRFGDTHTNAPSAVASSVTIWTFVVFATGVIRCIAKETFTP